MKRGFTLIEMLIVVAVLVTLMTITFRLSSVGSNQTRRNTTIARLQRVENCLSGYFAAFGSYPPVKLQGSRNIYLRVDGHGIQDDSSENKSIWGWDTDKFLRYVESGEIEEWRDSNFSQTSERTAWNQVRAACRAQPFESKFPPCKNRQARVKMVSSLIQERANSGEERFKEYWSDPDVKAKLSEGFGALADGESAVGRLANSTEDDWNQLQLFRFGVTSYILPRYLVMMGGNQQFFTSLCAQWSGNNSLPHNPMTGGDFSSWSTLRTTFLEDNGSYKTDNGFGLAQVANIPSQAVCARWLANLEGICLFPSGCKQSTFGVEISGEDPLQVTPSLGIYSPGGYGSTSDQYYLEEASVHDGWGEDLYYYSPPPYQSYTLWSSGPNERTFPPWIDRKDLGAAANKCVGVWIEDDIVHMSN